MRMPALQISQVWSGFFLSGTKTSWCCIFDWEGGIGWYGCAEVGKAVLGCQGIMQIVVEGAYVCVCRPCTIRRHGQFVPEWD